MCIFPDSFVYDLVVVGYNSVWKGLVSSPEMELSSCTTFIECQKYHSCVSHYVYHPVMSCNVIGWLHVKFYI